MGIQHRSILRRIEHFLVGASLLGVFGSAIGGEFREAKPPTELVFGARVDAAPLSFRRSGQWKGYSVELCEKIFHRYVKMYRDSLSQRDNEDIGRLEPKFVPVIAAERIDRLADGSIDAMCGVTTITVQRMKQVDFSFLSFVSGAGIMKKTQTNSRVLVTPGEEEQSPKVTYVGCTEDMQYSDCTTTDNWVANRFGRAISPIPRKSHDEAFEALKNDEAEFYVGDRVILAHRLRRLNQEKFGDSDAYTLAPGFLNYEPYAIALSKGNDLLAFAANATLAELYRSGEIGRIYDNYFDTEQSRLLKSMYQLQAIPE